MFFSSESKLDLFTTKEFFMSPFFQTRTVDPSLVKAKLSKMTQHLDLGINASMQELLLADLEEFARETKPPLFAPFPLLRDVKTAQNHAKRLRRVADLKHCTALTFIAKFYGFKQWKSFVMAVELFEKEMLDLATREVSIVHN